MDVLRMSDRVKNSLVRYAKVSVRVLLTKTTLFLLLHYEPDPGNPLGSPQFWVGSVLLGSICSGLIVLWSKRGTQRLVRTGLVLVRRSNRSLRSLNVVAFPLCVRQCVVEAIRITCRAADGLVGGGRSIQMVDSG
ncbi:hypothetical protein SFRURICE_009294 [Spodoptera frugiperda]|nr:hypothetical protein SFRURICE_009294 [Spodoptera frugiperda]